jgi:GDPmannose 4,6-dehydratase
MSPNTKKKALITGVTGQDGSYLAELLLSKGYEVHGIVRRSSSIGSWRIAHLYQDPHAEDVRFFLHYGDLSDANSLSGVLDRVRPDEVYHLAAQSHVRVSFDVPEYTGDVTGLGTLRLLEAIRDLGLRCKFYNAATSEMFGHCGDGRMLDETSPFQPSSPYACAKLFGYWSTVNYREGYGIFACNGILFNHESPRRGETFVTRKIVRSFASLARKDPDALPMYLGNLDAKRDWGYAPEYVEGMWRMLQHDKPGDYVLATSDSRTGREFCEHAAPHFGFEIEWKGKGLDEIGVDKKTGMTLVRLDPRYLRPVEVRSLVGDGTKARTVLGWEPKTTFEELVRIMCDAEKLPFHRVHDFEI